MHVPEMDSGPPSSREDAKRPPPELCQPGNAESDISPMSIATAKDEHGLTPTSSTKNEYTVSIHNDGSASLIERLLRTGDYFDIEVKIAGLGSKPAYLRLHRFVLYSGCPAFLECGRKAVPTQDKKEMDDELGNPVSNREAHAGCVDLLDLTAYGPSIVKSVISYLYSGDYDSPAKFPLAADKSVVEDSGWHSHGPKTGLDAAIMASRALKSSAQYAGWSRHAQIACLGRALGLDTLAKMAMDHFSSAITNVNTICNAVDTLYDGAMERQPFDEAKFHEIEGMIGIGLGRAMYTNRAELQDARIQERLATIPKLGCCLASYLAEEAMRLQQPVHPDSDPMWVDCEDFDLFN